MKMLLKQHIRSEKESRGSGVQLNPAIASCRCRILGLWGLQHGWWSGDEETGWITRLRSTGDYYAQALQRKSRLEIMRPKCAAKLENSAELVKIWILNKSEYVQIVFPVHATSLVVDIWIDVSIKP